MTDARANQSQMHILNGLAQLSRSFQVVGLKPPVAIILASHEEGMMLISAVYHNGRYIRDPSNPTGKPVEHPDGSVWMEVEIFGMAVRWPAQQRALPSNRFVWE